MGISSTNHVAVIVLNWNGLKDTLECLSSLEKSVYSSFDIILVDNASSELRTIDSFKKYMSKSSQKIELLLNEKNLGFSGGVNTGIRHALLSDYAYIALVNNDAVVDSLWLKYIVETFSTNEKIGIITGSLFHKNKKTIDSTGEIYSIWGLPFPRLRGRLISSIPESGYVFAATGGATVYRREVFESIGLFDEAFFAYYEDIDLGFRAQLQGWSTYYQREALAYHTQGASSNKIAGFTTKQAIRNLPLLYIKNVPGNLLLPVGLRFLLAYTLITTKALLSQNCKHALIGWLQGVWLFWAHGITERVIIQKDRNVSSEHINELLWHELPPDQTGLRKLFRRPVQ